MYAYMDQFEADDDQRDDERLCKEEDVVYVDLWDSFVGKEEMYARDGLHLSGKGLPPLPRDCQGRLPCSERTIFKLVRQGGLSKKALNIQADSRCKENRETHSKLKLNVCLNARSIIKNN